MQIGDYDIFDNSLDTIFSANKKVVVNTINAHSYIVAKEDSLFKKALKESDILLPDGEGVVLLAQTVFGKKIKKIAGADAHDVLLKKAEKEKLRCFYLGSKETTLQLIKNNLEKKYPTIQFGFFSPPFKNEFSKQDTSEMISVINDFKTDILFVGMTAPKQEKWVHQNKKDINSSIICSIGAVFDFIAGTKKRAPKWIIDSRLEWLYRSFTELRLAKRYAYSTPLFLVEICKLKFFNKNRQ